MAGAVVIRAERVADRHAIAEVNRLAFGGEAEAALVAALRDGETFIPELSLVAVADAEIVGHTLFSAVGIRNAGGARPALALAPMAVHPAVQRRGIGSRLVRRGLEIAGAMGHDLVIVLGHPEFYPRFGFVPASRHGVRPPFAVPDEVFMLAWLGAGEPTGLAGMVEYPAAFEGV